MVEPARVTGHRRDSSVAFVTCDRKRSHPEPERLACGAVSASKRPNFSRGLDPNTAASFEQGEDQRRAQDLFRRDA
jgi:hypothetical protein